MYLASVGAYLSRPAVMLWADIINIATGIMIIIAQAHGWRMVDFSLAHLSITVSLNVFLTLAIVIRLVLHGRNIRAATASRAGISGLYKTIATMLIESSSLYAVTSLLLIAMWATGSNASGVFVPIHGETQVRVLPRPQSPNPLSNVIIGQVIAPLLIIRRVANRSALTSDTIVTRPIDSFRARSRGESTGGSHALPGRYPTCSADNHGKDTSELGIAVEARANPQVSRF